MGCLIAIVVAIVAVVGLVMWSNKNKIKDWEDNKESLLPKIREAVEKGDDVAALELAGRYRIVEHAELQELIKKADTLKAERESREAKKAAEAEAEAKKKLAAGTTNQEVSGKRGQIESGIHAELGKGKSAEWKRLKEVRVDLLGTQAVVDFYAPGSVGKGFKKKGALSDALQVAQATFASGDKLTFIEIVSWVKEGDDYGNEKPVKWFSTSLSREEFAKLNWAKVKNSPAAIERFLKARAGLTYHRELE